MRGVTRPGWFVAATLALAACGRGGRATATPEAGDVCRDFERDMERVWSSERRRKIEGGAVTIAGEFGKEVVERVTTGLDVFARSWVMMKENACRDCVHRKLLPVAAYNRIAGCLDTALVRQQTLISLLEDPDRPMIAAADELAIKIADELQVCRRDALAVADPSGPEKGVDGASGREVQALRESLARAQTLREAMKLAEARVAVEEVLERARALDDVALVVAAFLERASGRLAAGEYPGAEQDARAAVEAARGSGDGRSEALARIEHTRTLLKTARFDEALREGVAAEEAARRHFREASPEYARAVHYLAWANHENGRNEAALAGYRKALALREELLGRAHPETARTLNNIGSVYLSRGEMDEALAWFSRALATYEETLGAGHPEAAEVLANIGVVYQTRGEHAEALARYERALAVYARAFGEVGHPSAAFAMRNIGKVHIKQGAIGEGIAWYERALAVQERTLGTEHPELRATLDSLALAYWRQDSLDRSLACYLRLVTLQEKALGPEHPRVADAMTGVAAVYLRKGAKSEALAWYQKVLALQEKVLGPDHPDTVMTRKSIELARAP
jgi:tetratricopeptide (TPR) repeat protein